MPFFLLAQVVDQLHVVIGQFHELFVYEILLATFTSVGSTTTHEYILLSSLFFL